MIVVVTELRRRAIRLVAAGRRELTFAVQRDGALGDISCCRFDVTETGSGRAPCHALPHVGHVHRKLVHQLCVAHPYMLRHLRH